ncbi:MAG: M13 family metallopeptidase [Alphaproteobacteria bacterium]
MTEAVHGLEYRPERWIHAVRRGGARSAGKIMQRIIVFVVFAFVSACAGGQHVSVGHGQAEIGAWGFDLAGMDTSVKPGNDFFRYANGKWHADAVVPPERSTIGSFTYLRIRSEERLTGILQELRAKEGLDPEAVKVRDLYRSFVDTARIEELGLSPAKADLDMIAGLRTHGDVARVMGSVPIGTESIFAAFIAVDSKNPDAYSMYLTQSGLGLPDRDYYLIGEKGAVAVREAYRSFIERMLRLAEIPDARRKAERVFALETDIAKIHWPAAERRNADRTYNPMQLADITALAPEFDWRAFVSETGIGELPGGKRTLIVREQTAFPALARLFRETPVAVWRDYLTFHYLRTHADFLPRRFDDANFDFYGKVVLGNEVQLERDKRGAHFVDAMMGEASGKLYVARYFPPAAKAKAQALVDNLMATYVERIKTRDWMTPPTKSKALEKVARMRVKIGYPDTWRDYSLYEVDAGDLFGNAVRGQVFEWRRRLARLDQPVDRNEWGMTPPTVNAYFNARGNEIVFPAAILQPPFFDPNADDAVNYGGIGGVIGHEISHGFDDQGSKFDASGVLQNWWTPEDRRNFEAKTEVLVTQFDEYEPLPGLRVNGKLTLGENIGDLSGLTIAHAAYRRSLRGRRAPVVDGFSSDQRVFLGWAQVWREKAREGYLRQRVLSNPHSPAEFRVTGTVRNVDAWYDAFGVTEGNQYFLPPAQRVHLW